jgi:hypothetical protein
MVRAADWRYLGGEALTSAGLAALPDECTIFVISAETAVVYYAINAGSASSTSPGYCPADSVRIEGPIGNMNQLAISVTGGTAHIQYFAQ